MSTNLTRYQKLQWKNTLVNIHDLICPCQQGLKHTLLTITEDKEEFKVTKEQKNNIEKCLISSEEIHTEEDIIGDGELATLFAEDGDIGDTAADTR